MHTSALVALTTDEYEPAGHAVHVLDATAAHVPARHAWHVELDGPVLDT